jgi:hypothetical protein
MSQDGPGGEVKLINAGQLRKRDLNDLRQRFNAWLEGIKTGKAYVPYEFTGSPRWYELLKELKKEDFTVTHYDGDCLPEYAGKWENSW